MKMFKYLLTFIVLWFVNGLSYIYIFHESDNPGTTMKAMLLAFIFVVFMGIADIRNDIQERKE